VEELDSVDDTEKYTAPPFMCLVEERAKENSPDVSIGMISICPSTGDIVWDDFDGMYLHSSTILQIDHFLRRHEHAA